MAWDDLAVGVLQEFASAQAQYAWKGAEIYHAARAVRERDRMREQRGGLKGYRYNDGRWRGRRPATKYVQLELPLSMRRPMRERLPTDRTGTTQKFTIFWRKEEGNGEVVVKEVDIYLTANTYPDGRLGELFIQIGKAGHTEAVYKEWAKQASRALQHGIPVDELFRQHVGTLFAPDGFTGNKDFPRCTSVLDLVSRWILSRYGSPQAQSWIASMQHKEAPPPPAEEPAKETLPSPTRWDLGAWEGAETMVEEKRRRSDGR